ncbi:hypothetical protein [Nocardioides acrostichi]|uniref:Uncharacterized protein n=1 Tax=Nocardioides acrostichi TaxID=2784339 RepID=A0A930UVD8_9ACTN|nr:hypothetical protein [Nocardioides acrostichi]MBF4161563.1 hypothetical protein [Nocardioides acrostichi]
MTSSMPVEGAESRLLRRLSAVDDTLRDLEAHARTEPADPMLEAALAAVCHSDPVFGGLAHDVEDGRLAWPDLLADPIAHGPHGVEAVRRAVVAVVRGG